MSYICSVRDLLSSSGLSSQNRPDSLINQSLVSCHLPNVEAVQIHYKNVHLKSNIRHGISQYLEEFIKKSQVCSERTNLKNLEGLLQNNREKDFQTQLNQQEKSAEIQMLKDRLSLNESKM
jgi:hypothetical protein